MFRRRELIRLSIAIAVHAPVSTALSYSPGVQNLELWRKHLSDKFPIFCNDNWRDISAFFVSSDSAPSKNWAATPDLLNSLRLSKPNAEMTMKIAARIQDDHVNGRFSLAHGWVISQTEADLGALFAKDF